MLIFTKRNDDKYREKYANNALKFFFSKIATISMEAARFRMEMILFFLSNQSQVEEKLDFVEKTE